MPPGEEGLTLRRAPNGVPSYREVWAVLKDDITSGRLDVGAELPAEGDLARTFGASKSVIRRALDGLVREGLVYKHQGKRSTVAPSGTERLVQVVDDYLADIGLLEANLTDLSFSADLLPSLDDPDEPIAEPVVRIRRTQGQAGRPRVCTEAYTPLAYWPEVADELGSRDAVTHLQTRAFLRYIHHGTRRIRAMSASTTLAELLSVPAGAPLLVLESRLLDSEGKLFELGTAWWAAEHFRLDVRIVPTR